MPRLFPSLLFSVAILIGGGTLSLAQDPAADLKDNPSSKTLAAALPLLADPAIRNQIRSTIQDLKPFPAKDLVSLLSHPQLAVRLGSLEILEEASGGDFSFNPWADPSDPDNEAPLALWMKWSESTDKTTAKSSRLLSEEQRHGYLRDLLSEDSNKSARARRMLEADGLASVGFLETFLTESNTLPAGSRAKVREAQYQIVLGPAYGPQAPAMARQLAFGSRDQTLSALGNLKSAGIGALPIIRDFLRHQDPLVRETAIDSILATVGSEALEIVAPVLADETDANVIHGALRRIKEIPGDTSLNIATSFLDREEEDLLISAIQACQKLVAGDPNDMTRFEFGEGRPTPKKDESSSKEAAHKTITSKLSDPRWRVRTAALEYIAAAKVTSASDKCVELLEDPDEFVRFSAIKASTALGNSDAAPVLRKMFFKDPGNVASVLQGYSALGSIPDDEMMDKLASYPADARIAAIEAAGSESRLAFITIRFARDADLDVSCTALRQLASSSERVDSPKIATILLEALRSNIPEKRNAVLEQIILPAGSQSMDPALLSDLGDFAKPPEKTTLDPLYDALLTPARDASGVSDDGIETIPGAKGELLSEIAKIAASDDSNSFRAALALAITGDPAGLKILLKNLPKYSTAQRAAIASKLYSPTRKEALDLLSKLVRDPVEEIRSEAVEAALSAENAPAFLVMALTALTEPDSTLTAHQFYSYRFESAARDGGTASRALMNWATTTLNDPEVKAPNLILALVALRNSLSGSSQATALSLAKSSPDKWIRRAAWYSFGNSSPNALAANASAIAEDSSPQVREVLPALITRMSQTWEHRFSDIHSQSDASWSSNNETRRITPEIAKILENLAATDPSPDVRYSAMAALLSHGREIDAEAFATLLRSRPKDERASFSVAYWMSENINRLGPGLAPIVSALDPATVNQQHMAIILAKVSPPNKKGAGFASFAALAANAESTEDAPQQIVPDSSSDTPTEVTRDSLPIIYFFKPGCKECEKASRLLDVLKNDFPLLKVERHNINETSGTLLNQALCARFNVPSNLHNIAPAIFTQSGFLIRNDIDPPGLGRLLTANMAVSQDDTWKELEKAEFEKAREKVEERYKNLTLPIVLIAGLIDGVNPCAFATIIFFLSYLQVARRTPREMLMVGFAFISAVFIAYFSAGLVLHSVLEKLTGHISGIKPYLDWGFAALAGVAAFLSFRDAAKAKAGKLDEMSLTLPGFLKDRIRGVIRTGTKARRFVIAAFVAGIIISFLELACTGQVYAPIIYSIQQGKMDAVAWLLAYNLAFIAPLVVIFALTFFGMSNKVLIDFQLRHTFSVKIALGIVFLALAATILLSAKFM